MKRFLIAVMILAGAFVLPLANCGDSNTPAVAPGKELILDLGNKVTLKLVQIPAGKFTMGSPDTEPGHRDDETRHEVTISKSFYLGVTPVTVDQFAAFVNETGYKTQAEKDGWSYGFVIEDGEVLESRAKGCTWKNPTIPQTGDHPVVHVNWHDAKAFCAWLSKKSGKKVALPTEAQWEFACRAGSSSAFPWGDDPDGGKPFSNLADESLKALVPKTPGPWANWKDGTAYTSPVASFKPNAFGLYDMTGNVCQWCEDTYGDYGDKAATDPAGAKGAGPKIQRGGSWFNPPERARSAFRRKCDPDKRYDDDGFRIAVIE